MEVSLGLETVEHETGSGSLWSVIWLHGLGADGNDFEPIIPALNLTESVRFIFPHAPIRPVTINGNFPMRAWYDIFSLERGRSEDQQGIQASSSEVLRLIEKEVQRGVPTTRIFHVGFSQGAAMALYTGLSCKEPLAGIIALSGYLPMAETLSSRKSKSNQTVPIFMAHGLMDPTVPESYGRKSKDILKADGYKVDWNTYPMDHSICDEEITDISQWFKKQFKKLG